MNPQIAKYWECFQWQVCVFFIHGSPFIHIVSLAFRSFFFLKSLGDITSSNTKILVLIQGQCFKSQDFQECYYACCDKKKKEVI